MFINPYFKFDNIYSKDINIGIASFDNSLFNKIGLEYRNSLSSDNGNLSIWNEDVEIPSTIVLNLVLYNNDTMRPIKWTNELISYIYDWLIVDNFSQFISDDNIDLIYYMKVVSIKKQLVIGSEEGYLEVEFQPFTNYAYMRIEEEIQVNGSSTVTINNLSKYSYKPIIEITNLGNTVTVNKMNNFEITSLETNETAIIDNQMLTVLSQNNKNYLTKCNRKWISLNSGGNEITIVGNCKVKILCEIPLSR